MSSDLEVFALISDSSAELGRALRAACTNSWVASYQIGFGPPILRATPKLTERARAANSALDKLDVYLAFLLDDERERKRLVDRLRLVALNRSGRLDPELLDRANNEALDLSLRLHQPVDAPPGVKREMLEAGVAAARDSSSEGPEALTARFCLRLSDPQNRGLSAWVGAPPTSWSLELWVPAAASALFGAFLEKVAERSGVRAQRAGSLTDRWARMDV